MNPTNLKIKIIGIFLLFAATLVLCTSWGPSCRRFASPPVTRTFADNLQVLICWRQERLKGRVLYLFDRQPHIAVGEASTSNDTYLSDALRSGITRTIVHVVPTQAWPEVSQKLSSQSEFTLIEGAFVMPLEEGRLYVTTTDRIKLVSEKVLVVINRPVVGNEDLTKIYGLLKRGVLQSDLVALVN
jgi:hypothetical protein